MSATAVDWKGAPDLEPFLRPVGELHTHPRNPKRGDVGEITKSLERFGQVRMILALADGTIVAGNHTYLAAVRLGWSRVAVVPHEFKTEEEARAYLVADNRLGERGEYDKAELRAHLEEIEQLDSWGGTGFVADDLGYLRDLQAAAERQPTPAPEPPAPSPAAAAGLEERILLLSEAQYEELTGFVRILRHEYGLEGITDTILRAVREEALLLNQGGAG